MIIRQSDLASASYCGMRQHLQAVGRANGLSERRLSGVVWGTVFHYAFQVLQQKRNAGDPDALEVALATLEHYWAADRVGQIAEGPVTEWMRGHTWAGLLSQGRQALKEAAKWLDKDERAGMVLLGVEHTFDVPIEIDGETHTLHGTVDSLKFGVEAGQPFLSIDDAKTGKKPDHLQYAMQWTVYAYASRHPDFWTPFLGVPGFDDVLDIVGSFGRDLWVRCGGRSLAPRRGRWLAAKNGRFEVSGCGWRTDQHYARMKVAIREYIRAQRAGVHPLTTDTAKCAYCPWVEACGQAPLPDFQEGVD